MKGNALLFAASFVVLLPLAVSAVHAEGPFATSTAQALSSSAPDEGLAASLTDGVMERASSTKSVDGQLTAEAHRGFVSGAAEALSQIADLEDPENGLGERLRIIAHALADGEPAVTDAMEQVAYRSAIDSFFGGNLKDIRVLETAYGQIGQYLSQLTDIEVSMTGVDRAAVATQVAALEEDRAMLARFIDAHR